MVIKPQNVLNDWFEVAQISQVPYKAYTGDPVDVLRAAAALRCDDPGVLCHVSKSDLWVFGSPHHVPPDPPSGSSLIFREKAAVAPSRLTAKAEGENSMRYLDAVRHAVIAQFASKPEYVPFGQSLLDRKDGSILHIKPAITLTGVLHIKVTRELACLRPVMDKSTPIVYLAPFGRLARIMDASATPSASLVRKLVEFLNEFCYMTVADLEEGIWFQVASDDQEFLWPQSLVLTSQETSPNLSWLGCKSWTAQLAEQAQELKRSQAASAAPSKPHFEAPAPYLMPPLPPPPPTPLGTNEGLYPTPHDNSPEKRHPEEELILAPVGGGGGDDDDDDEEEWNGKLTLADFSYFDTPIQKETLTPAPPAAPSEPSIKRAANPLQKSPHKRATGRFAPLELASDMDYKYSAGGRFFTTIEESDQQAKAVSSSSDDSDSDYYELEQPPDRIPDPWSFVVDTQAAPAFEIGLEQTPQTDKWLSMLLSRGKPLSQAWSMDCVAELLKQTVWDGANTLGLCDGILGTAEHVPVSPFFLKGLYPAAQIVSLAELSNSGINIPSRPSTPAIPGVEVAPPQQKQAASTENNFTLLSPPLYLVSRAKQRLKARASILRFWQPFGLQPISGPKDLTLVHMGLKADSRAAMRARFFEKLRYTYQQCELGKITLLNTGPIKDGIFEISADLEYVNPDTLGELFESACSVIKRCLLSAVDPSARVVIVMSWPAARRASILPAIRGYLALKSGLPNIKLVLYTRELEHIYTHERFSQLDIVQASLRFYDRWLPRYATTIGASEPAFKLAQLVPHSISLKFEAGPSAPILDADLTMHLAYSPSPCGRFLAAAWSDQWAGLTRIEAFQITDLKDTLREVWVRTAFICSQCCPKADPHKWRVAITKDGEISSDELDMWLSVASGNFFVVSVPFKPLYVDNENLFAHELERQEARDQVIVEAMDETHGIVFEPRLFASLVPVLAVGMLIKPWRDGHQQLEVHLLYGTSVVKSTTKQLLGQFRRLSSLASNVGVSYSDTISPWHVQAVAKMVNVLATL